MLYKPAETSEPSIMMRWSASSQRSREYSARDPIVVNLAVLRNGVLNGDQGDVDLLMEVVFEHANHCRIGVRMLPERL